MWPHGNVKLFPLLNLVEDSVCGVETDAYHYKFIGGVALLNADHSFPSECGASTGLD